MAQKSAGQPAEGFEQVVETLLLELKPRMQCILRHYRIPAYDAEDLVQEVLISFVRRHDSVENPEAWLVSALKYQCLLFWRKRRKQLCTAVDAGILEILAKHDAPLVEHEDRVRDLERFLRRIPPRCRKILRLRYGLGFTPKELAVELGYQRSSVSNIVRRCVATLTAELLAVDRPGGASHG